ncbi:pantetheine-phosphate adenylyltransferase [Actinotignum urinale]|uniref:pantetheine-phosphate adenylyltransferase n=1 Tax=Actinotignum urinale TaxID=190146 RepID=UPI00280C0FA2|nr:pantetheine-phosphate adenylyltransferase [Actinotignum urinale]MDY5129613.1 pantetheine-phosphate adenylyltransferase [Actinotignum urinale]
MTLAICPGSFDPVTFGHLDIFERASTLFDNIIVVVAHNTMKNALFTPEQRVRFIRDEVEHLSNVTVESVDGLLVDYARKINARAIVKGLRSAVDLDAEYPMALMNREISNIETVFVLGNPAKGHISSSLVKDVARYGGDVTSFVPAAVARALKEVMV